MLIVIYLAYYRKLSSFPSICVMRALFTRQASDNSCLHKHNEW